ncbi:ABC transporter ATP-binding protein [Spiroplasma endosymbiont of Polydrusus pterygomalis]|uniref:ABC transporter ATP-binding protein n=1 Tax=Spiroplasma endosymbiont of Polydrusus pterygomalis TaxID=3139327 RepID=UPI003CCB1D9A
MEKAILKPVISKSLIKKDDDTSQEKIYKIFNFKTYIRNWFNRYNRNVVVSAEDGQYAILIRDFTKQFKKFKAVDNANIKVKKGTIHGFIGPNGSGKTTTIKCLISAMVETKGDLIIHGKRSWTVEAKKQVGYIPEAAKFPKRITTYDYLISMGQISGLKYKVAKEKTEVILKELDLWKFKKRNPNAYSSGMKKKVLLAQSLLNNPDVLILDEPAANLDPTARTELFNDLRKLRQQGKTVFISSHILSELQHLADEVTVLNYSKVVYTGTVNKTDSLYEISSNHNDKLIKLLIAKDFIVEVNESHLLVNVKTETQVAEVLTIALKNNIIITYLKPYTVDLQTMYERIVMEANDNKKGEK